MGGGGAAEGKKNCVFLEEGAGEVCECIREGWRG